MRHAFSFPEHIRRALKNHIEKAVSGIAMERYHQEAAYTTALAKSLEGIVYDGKDGYVKIESTIFSDRGPHSAEKRSGADLAITAEISDKHKSVKKAILVQSKLGSICELSPNRTSELKDQVQKMKRYTKSAKVMEIPVENEQRCPKIVSARKFSKGEAYKSFELGDYFVRRILPTLDGDTRPKFVDGVQDSRLTRLNLIARLGLKQSIASYVKPKETKVPGLVKVLA